MTEDTIKTMLATLPTVQAWLGVSDVADSAARLVAAKARIYHAGLPAPTEGGRYTLAELEALRPYILYWETDWNVARVSNTGFGVSGDITLDFFESVPEGQVDDLSASYRTFRAAVKGMLEELAAYSQVTAGYLPVTGHGIPRDGGPFRLTPEEEQEQGIAQFCTAQIAYGESER